LVSVSGLANERQIEQTWSVAAMGEIDETFGEDFLSLHARSDLNCLKGVLYLGTAIALM